MSESAADGVPRVVLPEQGRSPPDVPPVASEPFDPARSQEVTRRAIALGVLVTTGLMLLGLPSLVLADADAAPRVETATALFLAPFLGFAGTVVGFYSGEKAGRAAKG